MQTSNHFEKYRRTTVFTLNISYFWGVFENYFVPCDKIVYKKYLKGLFKTFDAVRFARCLYDDR